MLSITIPDIELFDESTNSFSYVKGQTISLEHSLVSISKWESTWKEPFLSDKQKTREQTLDYIKCMTITQNVNPLLYKNLSKSIIDTVQNYMNDPMTATWFNKTPNQQQSKGRVITSELIYYWMIEAGIPMECQKWHINRLMTLIQVCNEERKAADPNNRNKLSARDMARSRSALNAQRKARMHTRG